MFTIRKSGILAIALALYCDPSIANECETDSLEQSLWTERPIDQQLETKLRGLFSCIDISHTPYTIDTPADEVACDMFVGQALQTVWGFNDFQSDPQNNNGQPQYPFMTAKQIANGLATGKLTHWQSLGAGDDQNANDNAANGAQASYPVIASWAPPANSTEHGHVALILPGGTAASGWGVNVPRSASVSLHNVNSSYIGCRVSAAFAVTKKSTVIYYTRDLNP